MPPKPTGKKGDVEDFSDASSLPQANIFKFTLVQKSYQDQESRERVRIAIKDKLLPSSAGRIQTLTRDDIQAYGKLKQIILDAVQLNALPAEDPRKHLSEFDMMARAASDKIFELSVQVRRQRQQKLAAAQTDENEVSDNVDGFIYMVDYPQSRAEILALSKYSQSLNAIFEIVEIKQQHDEDDEDEEEANAVQAKALTPDSEEARNQAENLLNAFKSARQDCDVRSALRQLAFLRVPYINQIATYYVNEADGSSTQKQRSAEDQFIVDLIAKGIDKFGQYYVQYQKFKKLVTVKPLVPDRASLQKIEELKFEQQKGSTMLQDAAFDLEHTIKELESSKQDEDDKDELARTDKEIHEHKEKFNLMKEQTEHRNSIITNEMQELLRKSKRSLDDEPQGPFDMSVYNNDFVSNSETSNNISSVLSAMITHIEGVNKGQVQRPTTSEPSTAYDSNIDDLFEQFSHEISCDLNLSDRGPDITKPLQLDSISTHPVLQIHDQTNRTLEVKQTVPAGLAEVEEQRLNKIAQREQQIFINLRVPGKNRESMPLIPNQSNRLRQAENPSFYPFCTLPVDEAERLLVLRAFQQMIKSNYLDEGSAGPNKKNKYKVFDRCFENHMQMDIFSQIFADALLDEPEITTMYYPRTDALIVALFNKVKVRQQIKQNEQKFKNVNQTNVTLNTEDADGERFWRASYRVMPDFENWLAVFADEIIQEQEIAKSHKEQSQLVPDAVAPAKSGKDKGPPVDAVDPNAIPVTLMKYVLDEEAIPNHLINVEDAKIQFITEKSAFMYPDDNSIIRVDHFSVGGKQFSKSIVMKDNLRFGLRARQDVTTEHKDFGLVRQVAVGDTEFYLHFENGTKLGLEQIQMERNPQKTIKVMPPAPTAEEIAYKLEQQKKFAEAAQRALKTNKPAPTDIEIPKTPQPTWETAPLNYLDTLFDENELKKSLARTTLTFKNGLIVQYLGNGHVLQMNEKIINGTDQDQEVDRLVTKEGIVIRQFENMDVDMLFPDGVHATFSKKNLEWIVTNNKGMQRRFQNGMFTDLPQIPCAVETDAVTGAQMMIREDEIVSVIYKDGSMYCQHRDGTKFHTSADGSEIRVEKRNFASHIVKIGQKDKQNANGPFTRSQDGIVVETYLPDGSKSQTFLDVVNTKNAGDQYAYRTMFSRGDLSIVTVDSLGHVSVISSNAREALNDLGEKRKMGEKDTDYLNELSRQHGQFTPLVYQAHINSKLGKSTIKTKNTLDETIFVLRNNMTIDKILNGVVLRPSQIQQQKEQNNKKKKPSKQQNQAVNNEQGNRIKMDLEIEETGQFIDPCQKSFIFPRLFVINNDGTAKELLSNEQLSYEMRNKGLKPEMSIKQKMQDVVNNQFVENTYILTKVINMEQVQLQHQLLNGIDLPENAKDALKGKLDVPDINLLLPKQQQFLFSQIFKMPDCDSFNQQAFANDYQRYIEWRMSNVRYETEFGIVHLLTNKDNKADFERIEDEEQFNKRIGVKILKNRAQPRQKFQYGDFKNSAMKELASSKSVKDFVESSLRSFHHSQASLPNSRKNITIEQEVKQFKKRETPFLKQETVIQQKKRVDKKLEQLHNMKIANDFIPDYFRTQEGQYFTETNPPKQLSEEAIIRMQQRLERQQRSQFNSQNDQAFDTEQPQKENEDARDNPIVALEPDELKQGSHFTGSKKDRSIMQGDHSKLTSEEIAALPSLYMQEKIYLYEKEQEALLKSEEHHIVKTKDFNVYGRLREEKPFVKSLAKSTAQNELNEKFITTECITDRRVKISSQAPRFYMNAPSVEDVRKQGQHQMILSAIEKKQTFGELINQANSMVTGVLHDNLKRSLNVMPGIVTFGSVRPGTINEVNLTIKNEDQIAHRITIKPMTDKHIVCKQNEYGIIAPGMTKTITVSIRVAEDETNFSIKDTIQIISKHDIFKVPVSATIVSASEFLDLNEKQLEQTGKSIQNSRVREKLLTKIAEASSVPPIVVLTKMPNKNSEQEFDFDM